MTTAFHGALGTAERSPQIPEEHNLYGFLVGSWELEVRRYAGVDVAGRGLAGEVHAGWVLQGRAVQDVWIMPRRRTEISPSSFHWLGHALDVDGVTWRLEGEFLARRLQL